MSLIDPQEDQNDLHVLANAKSTQVGRAMFRIIERAREKAEREHFKKPKICDEDFRKDYRWLMARADILRQLEKIPEEAYQLLTEGRTTQ